MPNPLRPFFDGSYAPHGYCLLWQPGLIWTHVVADALIALAYFSIPIVLVALVRRRADVGFGWIFWLFALFIAACGLTHIMSIWTLWHASYGLQAIVKVIAAVASVATAIVLLPLLPKALALPSPRALQDANAELAATIAERDSALARMRDEMAQRGLAEAALLQSRKLEALGQLSGGIAHDFNNLLQAISGNLELMEKYGNDPDRVHRWSRNAHKAIEHGKALANQMLAFSRVQKLTMEPVEIAGLIESMADLLQNSIGPTNRLEIDAIDPALVVTTDRTQIALALLNLAINSRDAMPRGGTVRISAHSRSGQVHPDLPDGEYVELAVHDSGVGMLPEVLERAVEPFFTTKAVGEGAGLGLSMVFGVTRQSGGTVVLRSRPGEGATVSLFLPRAVDHGLVADALPLPPRDLSGRLLLLIDDDDHVRQTIAEVLEETKARVISASSGEVGLRHLRDVRPDLLIVDFAMPDMNGAEVTALARATYSGLPVLIVTGHAVSEEVDAILGPGVDVLRKPFTLDALLDAIIAMLPDTADGQAPTQDQ